MNTHITQTKDKRTTKHKQILKRNAHTNKQHTNRTLTTTQTKTQTKQKHSTRKSQKNANRAQAKTANN